MGVLNIGTEKKKRKTTLKGKLKKVDIPLSETEKAALYTLKFRGYKEANKNINK